MDSSIFIFFNLLILFWLLSHIHSKSDDEKDDNDSLNSFFNSPFTKYTEILITFIFILYLYLNNDNQFKLIHIQNLIDLTKLNSEIYLFLLNISVSNVLFPFSWIILVIFYMVVVYCQIPGFRWYSIFDITSIILVIYYILNTLLLIPNTLSLIQNNTAFKVLSFLKLIVLVGLIGYTICFEKKTFETALCNTLGKKKLTNNLKEFIRIKKESK